MSDTTQAGTPAPTNALDAFFANIKKDWQVFEGDVISVCQKIEAGVEVAAADLTYSLSWLGSHIGQVAQTVSAVQNSVSALSAAGVPIPAALGNGITQLNQAVAGVNAALNNQAVAADASTALTEGYKATKELQVAAATAAGLAAAVQSATAPPATS
jgi:hypothetical protein